MRGKHDTEIEWTRQAKGGKKGECSEREPAGRGEGQVSGQEYRPDASDGEGIEDREGPRTQL